MKKLLKTKIKRKTTKNRKRIQSQNKNRVHLKTNKKRLPPQDNPLKPHPQRTPPPKPQPQKNPTCPQDSAFSWPSLRNVNQKVQDQTMKNPLQETKPVELGKEAKSTKLICRNWISARIDTRSNKTQISHFTCRRARTKSKVF